MTTVKKDVDGELQMLISPPASEIINRRSNCTLDLYMQGENVPQIEESKEPNGQTIMIDPAL